MVFANYSNLCHNTEMATTRRERQREATIDEIKGAALVQIGLGGGPSLTIRGVARAIGMSPAGLYRYYEGRDALLTDLIADAYRDLAVAVEEAIAESQTERLAERFAAGVRAYRGWAVTNSNRFLLIFGTPIPGYAAPEDGPTVAANRRVGQAFFGVAAAAVAAGELKATSGRPPTAGERAFAAEIRPMLPELSAEMIGVLLGTWAHWHGLVALEVTQQFDWIYPDDRDVFFEGELRRMITSLGFSG